MQRHVHQDGCHSPRRTRTNQDKCCPPGANSLNDHDCKPQCPNGVKEGTELCDGADCPANCDDGNACTNDKLNGSAAECNATCSNTLKARQTGDGCCLPGDDNTLDPDCSAMCGNHVKEGTEACDGADCPTNCDDSNACTSDSLMGTAAGCTAHCVNTTKNNSGTTKDGCCLPGVDQYLDADCNPRCGNSHVETGERCDGNCRSNCDDGNACTSDTMTGSPEQCNMLCSNTANTALCANGSCVSASSGYTCACNAGYDGSGTQMCTRKRWIYTPDGPTVLDTTTNLVWQRTVQTT